MLASFTEYCPLNSRIVRPPIPSVRGKKERRERKVVGGMAVAEIIEEARQGAEAG